MLLRIESFPHDFVLKDGEKIESPSPVLFAGPNTVRDGILIKVGRLDGDVVFSDKSVSREHFHLKLVSEKESFHVFLKDMSMFGSFIVKEDNSRSSTNTCDDSETGEDETVNEGEPSRASFNVLSKVTTQLVKNSNQATLKRVEPNSPVKINTLLHENGRVIVQCGQNGSTIVISRVPLNVVFSRLDKVIKDNLMIQLPLIGAQTVNFFDTTTTHLVAKDRICNAKNLVAWLSETPTVTSDFMTALLDRKHPSDPMPEESDYVPLGDTSDFWNTKPNPKLWAHLTLISLSQDEMESICRAAGAKIVPIYMAYGKEAIQRMRDSNCDGAFFVYSPASKYAKQIAELKRMKVTHVIQQTIASCALNQLPLTNLEGDALGTPVDPVITPNDSNKSKSQAVEDRPLLCVAPNHLKSNSKSPKLKKAINDHDEEYDVEDSVKEKSLPCRSQMHRHATIHTQKEKTEVPIQFKRHFANDEIQPDMESSQCDKSDNTLQQCRVESSKSQSQRKCSQQGRDVVSCHIQRTRQQSGEEFDEPCQQPKKRGHSESAESSFNKDEDPSRSGIKRSRHCHDTPVEKSKKKLLSKDEAGWFTAAPSGKKRSACLSTQLQLGGTLDEGQKVRPSAATHVMKGLIIGQQIGPGAQSTQIHGARNFKMFRKNIVNGGNLSARIQLRSVLPKETELQRRMNNNDRQLQEEQRKADALFSDRGGSIRGHFRQKEMRSRMS